jgi:hypothetical protein
MRGAALFFLALFFAVAGTPLAQRPPDDTCAFSNVERIVAVGDVHGAYDGLVRILRAAGVIDGRDRWSGGKAYLVQTGDVLDRGAASRKAMDLLRRLERDAPRAGGRVLALVGNHEVMRLLGELRDANPAEIDAFRTARSIDIRTEVRARWLIAEMEKARNAGTPANETRLSEQFDAQTPLGLIEMLNAFSEQGDYGKWIRGHSAVARINGILFMHGGISPRVAPLGCAAINSTVRTELTTGLEQMRTSLPTSFSMAEDSPLWYRGLARNEEAGTEPEVLTMLEAMQARAIVIGHTVTESGRITPRYGGRVVQIDTGMLTDVFKHGRPSALEIVGDRWTAIYEDSREEIQGKGQRAKGKGR